MRIHLQAQLCNPLQVLRLQRQRRKDRISIKIQRPCGRDAGIQLTQGPSSGIARIREPGLTGLLAFVVELTKGLEAEKDLTANFDRYILVQPQRDGTDRLHVPGYLLDGTAYAYRK